MEQILAEKELAEKLFGKNRIKGLKHMTTPFPLPFICYNEKEGFVGDDLGMFAKACNEFFPTPTDQGICLTKNLDIKEVIKSEKTLDYLFDSHLQDSKKSAKEGTLATQSTLIFFTGNVKDQVTKLSLMDQTNLRTKRAMKKMSGKFN